MNEALENTSDQEASVFDLPPEEERHIRETLAAEVEPTDPRNTDLPFPITVLCDRLLVRRDSATTKIGHIFIAQQHQEVPMRGTVVAVGDGPQDTDGLVYSEFNVGDRVLLSRYAGNEFKFDINDSDQYTVVREDEILLLLEDLDDMEPVTTESDCEKI